MDVSDIADFARVPVRTVRYVLSHKVVPGVRYRRAEGQAGRPRAFTEIEAYLVGLAAFVVHLGVHRKKIADVLAGLAAIRWPPPRIRRKPLALPGGPRGRTALEALYLQGTKASLRIAVGGAVRLRFDQSDTGWMNPASLAWFDAGTFQPLGGIYVNLRRLRAEFRRRRR